MKQNKQAKTKTIDKIKHLIDLRTFYSFGKSLFFVTITAGEKKIANIILLIHEPQFFLK